MFIIDYFLTLDETRIMFICFQIISCDKCRYLPNSLYVSTAKKAEILDGIYEFLSQGEYQDKKIVIRETVLNSKLYTYSTTVALSSDIYWFIIFFRLLVVYLVLFPTFFKMCIWFPTSSFI